MINLHDTKMMKIPSISQHPDGFFDQFFGQEKSAQLAKVWTVPSSKQGIHIAPKHE
jgi:hypothetical protein